LHLICKNHFAMKKEISEDFPFESKFIEVKESKIHYIEEGDGDPILFLHGAPTSNFLWRNIIPYMKAHGRCIAPDLIGMGKSDQPDIEYGYFKSYEYLDGFIKNLDLKNVTLVLHDWGSGLGFHYADLNKENIKAVVFMEAMVGIPDVKDMPASVRMAMKMMRGSITGPLMIKVANLLVTKMIPDLILRKLTKKEMDYYKMPYPTIKSRSSLLPWPKEIPIDGKPKDVEDAINSYRSWLSTTTIPMLGFEVTPGVAMPKKDVDWAKENIKNLKMVDLGEGKHFIQEDYPHEIGAEISNWYKDTF